MADVIDAALATAGTPCELGNDPSKYLEKFEDWYEHTSLLADAIGITSDEQKLRLMLLWGGKDFRKTVKDANVITTGTNKDTLQAALVKIRAQCGSHVNLTMAVYKLMHVQQGTKTFTQFKREVEELAVQCQLPVKIMVLIILIIIPQTGRPLASAGKGGVQRRSQTRI